MLSRDLVPIAQGCPLAGGIGKPLPIAVGNRIGARGCGRSLVSANSGYYPCAGRIERAHERLIAGLVMTCP
jgi:hypothetical protein